MKRDLLDPSKVALVALFMLFWYLAQYAVSLVFYISWLRYQVSLLGNGTIRAHLAFMVIGGMVFATVGAVFLIKVIKYSDDRKQQKNDMAVGIAFVFFSQSLPLFAIEASIVHYNGFQSIVQTLSFLCMIVSFFLGAGLVWFGYMWNMSKRLEQRSSAGVLIGGTAQSGTMRGGYGVYPRAAGADAYYTRFV
eukprot:TRINITY_DN56038_c0_g1_i1.p2 TRINITY_DN56038_c0_g1~~TRINITY_DN56038_c0_g1_i1.p2  ORF type:complete len:192 (+),score=48.61 TRINITY_DN56038_c0_g1_i1:69-644(+)